jgi:hypothetical protein
MKTPGSVRHASHYLTLPKHFQPNEIRRITLHAGISPFIPHH